MPEVVKIDPIFSKIVVVETGSGAPCIDLSHVSFELSHASTDADLVVLVGMGRAIHTNFNAKFAVDSLKIAVFKNPQVCKELGFQMYDGMIKFEQGADY